MKKFEDRDKGHIDRKIDDIMEEVAFAIAKEDLEEFNRVEQELSNNKRHVPQELEESMNKLIAACENKTKHVDAG